MALKSRGIEPFVTLWHWTIPVWLYDAKGFATPFAVKRFEIFVEKIVTALGSDIKFWVTLNEPEVYLGASYIKGQWPPQKRNIFLARKVLNNLLFAHRSAYKIIKKINPEAQVGIAKNNIYFESAGGFVNNFLTNISSWFSNRLILSLIKKHQDFIGLNYYFHSRVNYGFGKNKNAKVSDLGWELYPEGLYNVLGELHKYFKGVPIYVTESGLAVRRDKNRSWFIEENFKALRRAKGEGVKVLGYMHWSFMDNFEWDKGFWPRFGLIEIDYGTGERKIRPSALIYKKLISEWNN